MSSKHEVSYVQEVVESMRIAERMAEYRAVNTTCISCSCAETIPITLTGDEIPFDQKDEIETLNDLKYRCNHKTSDSEICAHCHHGDKVMADVRCSKCAQADRVIEGTYYIKSSNGALVRQNLYHCGCNRNDTGSKEYNYPYYRCDHFIPM